MTGGGGGPAGSNRNADLPPHSTDVDEECRRVVQALDAVFSADAAAATSPDATADAASGLAASRDVANRYLTSFQRQAVAWMVCDRLLNASSSSAAGTNNSAAVQSQFFAAQTLHAKCRTDVVQLPPDSLPSLRDSLMNHLTSVSTSSGGGNRALVTRLAMASAALAVQMSWFSVIEDVLSGVLGITLGGGSDRNVNADAMIPTRPELVPAALELFKLLPEETCSDRLILQDDMLRNQFGRRLEDSSGMLFAFLLRTAKTNAERGPAAEDLTIAENVLHTLHSWVRYVRFHPRVLEGSPLVEWTFHVLADPRYEGDCYEAAVDVVVEILRAFPSDYPENERLVHGVIPLAMSLGRPEADGPFRSALASADEDQLRGYCRIFTEMGESYMSLIMCHQDLNQASLVDLVLDCSAIPDKGRSTSGLLFLRLMYCLLSILFFSHTCIIIPPRIRSLTQKLLRLRSTFGIDLFLG